jgi:hypothetical protein
MAAKLSEMRPDTVQKNMKPVPGHLLIVPTLRLDLCCEIQAADKTFLSIHYNHSLTGFLGSGKTSFLQYFIEYQTQRSRFVAAIQNEIGEVGLDGKLLDYAVTEIDEGCVCCSPDVHWED